MAQRKLRLEVKQSNEQGECGNPRAPRWYGRHSVTTDDITGSVMKILITDSKGERISITIDNNGSIQAVNNNRECNEDPRICISPNDLQIERRMNAIGNALPNIVNNQETAGQIIDSDVILVKEELKEPEEPSIPINQDIGVISEGYKAEPPDPEVEEEFHTEMIVIKSEELDLAGKYETVDMDSEILSPEIQSTNDIGLLCRLCAAQRKNMIHIFSPDEAYKNITEKIQDCLPIVVRETDTLPKQVCRFCWEKLEMFHKFYKTVEEAEKQLNILSEKISEELRIAEKINETLPPQEVQLVGEKSGEESVTDKKPTTGYKLCSLPVTLRNPELLNSGKQGVDENNTDEDVIFMGETTIIDDFDEEEDEEEEEEEEDEEDEKEEEEEEGEQQEEDEDEEFDIIKCRICGLYFGTAKSCYMHALIHNSEDYYPCSMCDEILTTREDSLKHSMWHVVRRQIRRRAPTSNKNGSSCNPGTARISDEDNTDGNILCSQEPVEDETPVDKNEEDMIQCRICSRYFGSTKSCQRHSAVHASDNCWPCSMCDKIFLNARDNLRHSQQHAVPKKRHSRTTIIAKTLPNVNSKSLPDTRSERLSNSTKVIAGKNETDDNITPGKGTVDNQASVGHSNSKTTVKCRLCGATFLDTRSCYSHAKVHVEEDYYPCVMCDKIFTTTKESWRHALDHVKDKNDERQSSVFMCNTCGRRFVTEDRLRFHEIYHDPKKRPCYCELCDKLLASERSLYHHMLGVHKRCKKYSCDICREQFKNQLQLDSHLLLHAIERFECSVCNRSFSSNDELELHRREHHRPPTQMVYSCFYCGKTFLQKCHLSDHIRKNSDECPYIFTRTSVNNGGGNKDEKTPKDGGKSNSTEPARRRNPRTEKKRPTDCSLPSESFRVKKSRTEYPRAIHIHDKQCQCDVCKKKFSMPSITRIQRRTRDSMK